MLTGIPAGRVASVWPAVAPMLARALDHGQGDYGLDDIRALLLDRSCQLWAWIEDGAIAACCVTTIIVYPRRKVCGLMLVGGKGLARWLDAAQPVIAAWARAQGCTQLEGYARKGWLRVLKDWRTAWTQIRRDI